MSRLTRGNIPEIMKIMDSNRACICFQLINIILSVNQFYASFPTDGTTGNLYAQNIFDVSLMLLMCLNGSVRHWTLADCVSTTSPSLFKSRWCECNQSVGVWIWKYDSALTWPFWSTKDTIVLKMFRTFSAELVLFSTWCNFLQYSKCFVYFLHLVTCFPVKTISLVQISYCVIL